MTFQSDKRDRLIHETRVVNTSTTAYDIGYTCDGLGNRLEKTDCAAVPRNADHGTPDAVDRLETGPTRAYRTLK